MSEDQEVTNGLSRRDMLRRAAIVGGVAWAAPVVTTLGAPAFADGSQAAGGDCDRFVFVKYNFGGDGSASFTGSEGQGNISCFNYLDAVVPGPASAIQLNQVTGSSSAGDTTTATITGEGTITGVASVEGETDCVTITVPDDCRIYAYINKLGGGPGCAAGTVQNLALGLPGNKLPQTLKICSEKFSHVDLVLCCND